MSTAVQCACKARDAKPALCARIWETSARRLTSDPHAYAHSHQMPNKRALEAGKPSSWPCSMWYDLLCNMYAFLANTHAHANSVQPNQTAYPSCSMLDLVIYNVRHPDEIPPPALCMVCMRMHPYVEHGMHANATLCRQTTTSWLSGFHSATTSNNELHTVTRRFSSSNSKSGRDGTGDHLHGTTYYQANCWPAYSCIFKVL